ncbi:MAG: GNAT family N-acetyltransferase [Candidatus Limnocylindrales bacterium]
MSKPSEDTIPPAGHLAVPPGHVPIPVRTSYLEMCANAVPDPPAVPAGFAVRRWRRPPPDEYLSLFSAVGGEWGWSGRLLLGDDELRALLNDPAIEIIRLRCGSRIAGFVELDRRLPGQVEIVYFGLVAEFIGRGLGAFLLRWATNRAWQGSTERVWLHTCDYDHPNALAVYQKAGFRIYDERMGMESYPEDFVARLGPTRD